MRVRASCVALAAVLATGTFGCDRGAKVKKKPAPDPTALAAPDAAPSAHAAAPKDAGSPRAEVDGDAGPSRFTASDAGAASCRIAYGPAELPFWGPAALSATPTELRVVANDGGRPRVHAIPIAKPPPPSANGAVAARPTSFDSMRSPACEIAGPWAYCQGPGGVVSRTKIGERDTKAVAKGRAGTRFSAAALGDGHAVVATLDTRQTTEGETMHAFVTLDDREPVRLSEAGAGATTVHLVPQGSKVIAVYIDARAAMLPLHARVLTLKDGALALGEDAVVFIGGPPERSVDFAVATTEGSIYALLPMPRETATFGMAAVPIDDPPRTDVEAVWSMYPNGLDPAPIAATRAGALAWVARVRPKEAAPTSPRVLELGRIAGDGVFTPAGTVAEGRAVTHVAVTTDVHGTLWIVYGDRSGSWLERLVCT